MFKTSQKGKIRFYILFLCLTGATGLMIFAWVVGGKLMTPAHRSAGHPSIPYTHVNIVIKSNSGSHIHGWLYHVNDNAPAIALFHGVRSNRGSMLKRAEFLIGSGYNVLVIDMQAHGESKGEHITFGFLESMDVKAAITYLRRKYVGMKIGAIGVSMGGAACLLGTHPARVDALVLEAVYPNIVDAVKNRLEVRLGKAARILSPLLTVQFSLRLGIDLDKLSPEKAIRKFKGSLLLIAGSHDKRTRLQESHRLFRNAKGPKSMWIVKNASHTDYHNYASQQYQKRILGFFNAYLINTHTRPEN